MESAILKLLGYPTTESVDESTHRLIQKAMAEVEKIAQFKYTYAHFDHLLLFLENNSAYLQYLNLGQSTNNQQVEYLLCATTLGVQIDRYLQRIQVTDMAYATIFDAAANVYLEARANEFEKKLPFADIDFRFCPGYGGTPLTDNKSIAQCIHAESIGISFLDSGLMIPLKSMMGVIRIGGKKEKSCDNCVALETCSYRKFGKTCYAK